MTASSKVDTQNLTDEQKALANELTKLQVGTVLRIVQGMSQREAYYQAGGKAKTNGTADATVSRMLSDRKVDAFYQSLIGSMSRESIMTRQEALERLTRSARTTILDIAEFKNEVIGQDDDGNPVTQTVWRIKNSDEITPEAAAAIKAVTSTKYGPKLELHDSQAAVKQIADMEGWNAPRKSEVTGKDGEPLQVQADVTSEDVASAVHELLSYL